MNWRFKYSLKLNGFPVKEALLEYAQLRSNQLNSNQRAFLRFKDFEQKNPFYQKFLKSKVVNNIEKWEDIPIIQKKDFQVNIEQIIGDVSLKNLHIHSTSGSTGTPFYFAKNKFCHAMTWAHTDAKLLEHGLHIGSSLQARFYGIPLGGLKYYKERFKDFLGARVRYPVFDLSDENLLNVIKDFRLKKFEYINGYTSSLVVFAKFLIARNIVLKEICPSLRLVMPTSEVCDDIDRKNLEKGFGVKVVNEYGAAELDVIAMEDSDGDFVLNEETLFVEVLNEDNLPVKTGEEGKVIITALFNEAMPFIRYEIGDRAVLSDKFKNGRRVLANVIGRTNDIIKLPSGKVSPGLTFYYITKSLLEEVGNVLEFKIIQTQLNEFILEYVSTQELSKGTKVSLQNAMDNYLEKGLTVKLKRVAFVSRTKAGKLKHFISLIS
jgi:phenylacetate-CoA ligase